MATHFPERLDAIRAEGKRVLVVGLGVTGVETARFLSARGISVVCTEKQSEATFIAKSKFSGEIASLSTRGIEFRFGIDGEMIAPFLANVKLAVLSPGVPLESAIVGSITRAGIPYVSELELGILLHGGRSVVVTGSNGKTTTVSLIHHILTSSGISAFLCGNVGTPVLASSELNQNSSPSNRSVLVVEASSYQLEACTALKPNVSVILNISENHLERHGTIERYAAAKGNVLKLQGEGDITVLNSDDVVLKRMAASCKGEVVFFGKGGPSESKLKKTVGFTRSYGADGAPLDSVWAQGFAGAARGDEREHSQDVSVANSLEDYPLHECHLMGEHNTYNMAAAVAACRALGVSREQILQGLSSFLPLEHRLEPVAFEIPSDFEAINDSKSTTVAATKAAYITVRDRYPNKPIVLMIGGLSKAGSWDPLLKEISNNPHHTNSVVCFGKDGPLLAGHCKAKGLAAVVVANLRDGVAYAITEAALLKGVILLSPGCASFDEFTDFEHRGREFKRFVTELSGVASRESRSVA